MLNRYRAALVVIAVISVLAAGGAFIIARDGASDANASVAVATATVNPVTEPNQLVTPTATAGMDATAVGPQAAATAPPNVPDAHAPIPTRCAATLITKAGQPFEVIGPGAAVTEVPAPGDYVKDSCSGQVYFKDPRTGSELPSVQVGDERARSGSH